MLIALKEQVGRGNWYVWLAGVASDSCSAPSLRRLHYMHYNFCRIHQTLRVTPAMEAGISDHVWSLDEVIGLLD